MDGWDESNDGRDPWVGGRARRYWLGRDGGGLVDPHVRRSVDSTFALVLARLQMRPRRRPSLGLTAAWWATLLVDTLILHRIKILWFSQAVPPVCN